MNKKFKIFNHKPMFSIKINSCMNFKFLDALYYSLKDTLYYSLSYINAMNAINKSTFFYGIAFGKSILK